MNEWCTQIVLPLGGSISAEHGIGVPEALAAAGRQGPRSSST
jgi:FAD/FMN-containing dehydrogenase